MKISQKLYIYLASLLFISSIGLVNAATVSIVKQTGTLQTTNALSGFATTGADMDGMSLGITYGDGTTTSAIWGATGSTSGAANWANGSLALFGDSFSRSWILAARTGISSILLDAGAGNSVFDTYFGNQTGTDGSARGRDFDVTAATADYDIVATYFDAVALTGDAPVGDLFRYLHIDFKQAFVGTLNFVQDTDNLSLAGDISPVPVPAAAWLFGSALLGFFGFSKRKKV